MKLHLGAGPAFDCAHWQEADATATLAELRGTSHGLRHERHVVELEGRVFEQAREELLAFRWFPPRFVTATVCSDGVTVVQRCRIGLILSVDAPVRVVERLDEPHRAALAVVTLRGHPERGVERYELVRDPGLDRATLTERRRGNSPIRWRGWSRRSRSGSRATPRVLLCADSATSADTRAACAPRRTHPGLNPEMCSPKDWMGVERG